jgi:hypothetical protein
MNDLSLNHSLYVCSKLKPGDRVYYCFSENIKYLYGEIGWHIVESISHFLNNDGYYLRLAGIENEITIGGDYINRVLLQYRYERIARGATNLPYIIGDV